MKNLKPLILASTLILAANVHAERDHDDTWNSTVVTSDSGSTNLENLERNRCDELPRTTDEERAFLDRCLNRLGASPYRAELLRRAEEAGLEDVEDPTDLIQRKTFSREDLKNEFFVERIYAFYTDMDDLHEIKVQFDLNYVCKGLGYMKALHAKVSTVDADSVYVSDIETNNASDKIGYVINSNGQPKKYKYSWTDSGAGSSDILRALDEITCVKVPEGSLELLADFPEALYDIASTSTDSPSTDRDGSVVDGRRDSDDGEPRVRRRSSYGAYTSGIEQ